MLEKLTLQESALAAAMIHRVGDTTVRFSLRNGDKIHATPRVTEAEVSRLIPDYAKDPKESLAWAREALMAISGDSRLSETDKNKRLSRYLDAYFGLTIKLDHTAFPPSLPEEVKYGVPEYLPDGFVDMGGEKHRDPVYRDREMIGVDKEAIFNKYKPIFMEMFAKDFNGDSLEVKKSKMLSFLAQKVYYDLPHVGEVNGLGGGIIGLSSFSEGVCRHQALVFQVLAQAAGLKTRLLKCHMTRNGVSMGRHSTNMARLEGQWMVLDVSCPDYIEKDGQKLWRAGAIKADRPPQRGETRIYKGSLKHRGLPVEYEAHDDMYWFIDEPSSSK